MMLAPAAVAAAYVAPWWIALGAGLVVLVVVVVLLGRLLHVVADVDRGVRAVWEAATEVAGNTATTWQLNETGDALERIAAEAHLHTELLSRE